MKKIVVRSILLLSLMALPFSVGCGKKEKKLTAEQYNESVAAENKAKAEAEAKAKAEAKAQQEKEDAEKFKAKTADELQKEAKDKELEKKEPEIVEENKSLYEDVVVVDSDDPEVIQEVESQAEQVNESLANSEDVNERVQQYTELQEGQVNIVELENSAWQDIVTNIQRSTNPDFVGGYTGYYADLDAVYEDIDKTYAGYSENVRESLKSLAKTSWDYYREENKRIMNQPNPWTAEEIEEDIARLDYTREEYDAIFGGNQEGGFIMLE